MHARGIEVRRARNYGSTMGCCKERSAVQQDVEMMPAAAEVRVIDDVGELPARSQEQLDKLREARVS